jgi:hypothetical protein
MRLVVYCLVALMMRILLDTNPFHARNRSSGDSRQLQLVLEFGRRGTVRLLGTCITFQTRCKRVNDLH